MENTKNSFLPKDYEVPQTSGNYFKLVVGENRFRILGSAIIGWLAWDKSGEKPKPIRKKIDEKFEEGEIQMDANDKIKHFWAFKVWSTKEKKVQILEITQQSIMKDIKALTLDEDWGDPTAYDITITRVGEKLETEYTTNPKPKAELDKEITDEINKVKIDINKLYTGEDPFDNNTNNDTKDNSSDVDDEDISDIPF